MKILTTLVGSLVVALLVAASTGFAAPVESVERGPALTARQTVDQYLSQQVIVDHLATLGLTAAEASARVDRLSTTALEQLAAQIETVRAGGTIQGGNPHPFGPLACIFRPLANLFKSVYRLFCWQHSTY